jgi:hypothetical protein
LKIMVDRSTRAALGALALTAVALTPHAGAQDPVTISPLSRLAPGTRYSYELILDSARKMGLPTARLESRALEGISKRGSDRKILDAVRNEFHAVREARAALGARASNDELDAAASALRAGITAGELSQLSRSRQGRLTVPLVVLVDLVTRSVPRDTAYQTIFSLYRAGAGDDDFHGLWRGVERDIVSGTDPGVALLNRAREIPARGPPPVSPPSGRPDQSETQDR